MSSEEKYVTPEYLLSHGFIQYKSEEEGDVYDIPFQNEDDLHFRELGFDRNMFVVIFSQDIDEERNHLFHHIYVQDDAGCGFVQIPERWWNLPVDYFESIYYGIRGEKPKFSPKHFTDAEFEVIPPLMIRDKNDEKCDATDDAQGTKAG